MKDETLSRNIHSCKRAVAFHSQGEIERAKQASKRVTYRFLLNYLVDRYDNIYLAWKHTNEIKGNEDNPF